MTFGDSRHGNPRACMLLACLVALLCAAAPAQGQDKAQDKDKDKEQALPESPTNAPTSSVPNPWAKGVSQEQQDLANPFYEQGNRFFERSQFAQALAKYREAIEHWEHPAIRYNMAICLINLDEPLEAHNNLKLGLAYGVAPLSPELLAEGQTYMRLLLGRLARVRIRTAEAGAKVALDGQDLFIGPGATTRLLLPGKHQLVAKKEGMITHTQVFAPEPGKETEIKIKMLAATEEIVIERRWQVWKPWAVLGAGAGLALLGVPLYYLAGSDFQSYEDQFAAHDDCKNGCAEDKVPSDLKRLETRANIEDTTATAMLIVGGAVAAMGVVLVVLNRPRAVEALPAAIRLSPVVDGDSIGLMTRFDF